MIEYYPKLLNVNIDLLLCKFAPGVAFFELHLLEAVCNIPGCLLSWDQFPAQNIEVLKKRENIHQ